MCKQQTFMEINDSFINEIPLPGFVFTLQKEE